MTERGKHRAGWLNDNGFLPTIVFENEVVLKNIKLNLFVVCYIYKKICLMFWVKSSKSKCGYDFCRQCHKLHNEGKRRKGNVLWICGMGWSYYSGTPCITKQTCTYRPQQGQFYWSEMIGSKHVELILIDPDRSKHPWTLSSIEIW